MSMVQELKIGTFTGRSNFLANMYENIELILISPFLAWLGQQLIIWPA